MRKEEIKEFFISNPRTAGAIYFVFGSVIAKFSLWDVYHRAVYERAERISYSPYFMILSVVVTLLGIFLIVFGASGMKILQPQQHNSLSSSRLSKAVAILLFLIGATCAWWIDAQFSALGYK